MCFLRTKVFCCLFFLFLLLNIVLSQNKEGDSCIDEYTNTYGICTLSRKCQSAKKALQQNGITPTFCPTNHAVVLVCCRDTSTILDVAGSRPNTLSDRPVWADSNTSGKRISVRKCEEYSLIVTKPVKFFALLPEPENMTLSTSNCQHAGVELIVGGTNAQLGEFPHMTAIGWANFEGGYSFNCGGSLISPRFVLTAAHCTFDPRQNTPEPVIVRLGDRNLNPEVDDGATPVEIPIKSIKKHPSYESPVLYNDIALLQLLTAAELNGNIRPACLWTGGEFTSDKAIATGWGVTDTRFRRTSEELQKVSLTLLRNNYCDGILINDRNRNWDGFRDTQMCAGELQGKKDTCQGDSGAPLQLVSKDNPCVHYIIGITSFGKECALKGRPAIYTRVSAFLDWIERIVWANEQ